MRVHVHVQRRHDGLVVLVLDVRELLGEAGGIVIVDERHDRDLLGTGAPVLPFALHEGVPDQIANGLQSIGVAPLGDEPVELLEQVLLQGDSDSLDHVGLQ